MPAFWKVSHDFMWTWPLTWKQGFLRLLQINNFNRKIFQFFTSVWTSGITILDYQSMTVTITWNTFVLRCSKNQKMNIKMDSDAYGTRTSLLTKRVMVQVHGVCLLVCPVDLSFCLWGRFCQDRALHILWSVKCQGYKLNHYEFASLKWFCVSVWKTREKWFGRFILRLRCRYD